MTAPRISVVVPTYNRLDTLRHVIPSLLAQDLRRGEYEVVVADSNSTDGTAEYLAGVARGAPFVRHLPGPYTGRAAARNAGIAASQAPVVLFTDADIIASPDLLSRHLAHHEKPGARAIVGMEVQVSSYDDYLAKRSDHGKREPLHGDEPKRLSWLYFLTGNASAPRADLDRVGRFDEDFTGYGHEDLSSATACSTGASRSCTSRAR
ncbi:MAG TPA: glycosyltransferase family A protein [Solirubrobacteraceae bacterium]|nr:glycosyltransferase family A protein [Solirubrobacteraceae bacterium]